MKLSRPDFRPIIRGLHRIRRAGSPEDRRNELQIWHDQTQDDDQPSEVGMFWFRRGIGATALRLLEGKLPLPLHYDVFVTDPLTKLSTCYDINSLGQSRTILKDVIDSLPMRDQWPEGFTYDRKLENSLGINDISLEDVDVLKGIIARRLAEVESS